MQSMHRNEYLFLLHLPFCSFSCWLLFLGVCSSVTAFIQKREREEKEKEKEKQRQRERERRRSDVDCEFGFEALWRSPSLLACVAWSASSVLNLLSLLFILRGGPGRSGRPEIKRREERERVDDSEVL